MCDNGTCPDCDGPLDDVDGGCPACAAAYAAIFETLGYHCGLNADFWCRAWRVASASGDCYLCDGEDGTVTLISRVDDDEAGETYDTEHGTCRLKDWRTLVEFARTLRV